MDLQPALFAEATSPSMPEPDPQQARVLSHARGPMVVTGAPGTGKSWVLRERFARLIEGGADPERVALVVRSRSARSQARASLLARLSMNLPGLEILTVHGLAYHVMGQRFRVLEYDQPPEVLSAADQFARVHELLAGEDPEDWPVYGAMLGLRGFADQVRQFLLRAQEALVEPDDVLARAEAGGARVRGWLEIGRFYARYLQVLGDLRAVDFAALVNQAAAAAGSGEPLFDHVLVDDYQEASFAEEALLVKLAPATLVAAGDLGSHIFSFQGTTDEPLRRFSERLPTAEHTQLDTAHRAAAPRIEAWYTPHISDEHAAVARELRRVHVEEVVPWGELAVVVRRQGAHLGGLLRALDDAGVPRSVPERGLSLLAEPGTYPFVLALRWLARPEKREALLESLLTSDLVRLSPADTRGLVRTARAAGWSAAEALRHADGLWPVAAEAVRDVAAVLDEAEAVAGRSVLDAFGILWRHLRYSGRLVEAAGRAGGRRDLDAAVAFSNAVASASERGDVPVAAFLETLEAGREGPGLTAAEPDGVDAVRVFTAHGIAGREFDTIMLAGAVEGDFPSLSRPEPMFDLAVLDHPVSQSERNRERLADERRLFGVVVTRARRRVVLTASDPHGEDAAVSGRSRFAAELGLPWTAAPAAPFREPLTVAEASATWRRTLADGRASRPQRLASLAGILALGQDCSRWWFRREWTGTSRPLHESIRVSHSRLDKLDNCQLQFVLGQEIGLEGRAGYHAWVGSLVHKLIEDCETGVVERSLSALAAEALRRWRQEEFPSFAVSEAFRRLVTEVMLPAWFREYGETPAVARELRFDFEYDGALVTGYIDRIGQIQNGGTCITDYKTGKVRNAPQADESLQLGIYYLAVNHAEELAPYRPVRGIELVFLRDSDWQTGGIARRAKGFAKKDEPEYRERMEGRLSELVGTVRELLAGEVYRPNPAANCMFCEFRTLCPLWPEGREVFPVPVASEVLP